MIRTNHPRPRKPTLGFKARSLRGSAIIEEPSEEDNTSVTSNTSNSADDPKIIRETKSVSVGFTPIPKTQTDSAAEDVAEKNPWQWHGMLTEAEAVRRQSIAEKLEAAEQQVKPLQKIVTESVEETKKANRFIVGLALAQQRLAEALILTEEEDDDDFACDDEEEAESYLGNVAEDELSDVVDLPEKLRTDDENGTTVRSVVFVDEETSGDGGNEANATIEKKKNPSCNDGSTPPIFSVSIPNVNATEESVYVLHKQHDLLQQTIGRSVPCTEKIGALKEDVETKFVPFGPSEIVQRLKISEDKVQLLWDTYCTTAKEVLVQQDANEEEEAETDNKYSEGDAWVAELAYRCAVAQQLEEWNEFGETFPGVMDEVKDFEGHHRVKLHKCLHSVMQKQAYTFKRAHQAHADALKNWVHTEETADAKDDKSENKHTHKSDKRKKGKKKQKDVVTKEKIVLTSKERIQQIADFAGATTVWDKSDEKKQEEVEKEKPVPSWDLASMARQSAEVDGIDVDMYMDVSSDDDDLPLLADSKSGRKDTEKNSPVAAKKRNSSKRDESKRTKAAKARHREVTIHNNIVVLDRESSLLANFMDRLLFSASLLESYYVTFSVVAGLSVGDDCLRASAASNVIDIAGKEDESVAANRNALVIITCDLALHLFELPKTATSLSDDYIKGFTGNGKLQPEDALSILLKGQELEDRKRKQQLVEQSQAAASDKSPSSSPTKMLLRLRRNKQVEEEEPEAFEFSYLRPTASISLHEYNVRVTRRGQFAVKLSSKNRNPGQLSNEYSRINLELSTLEEQRALVDATRGENNMQRSRKVNRNSGLHHDRSVE